MSDAVQRSFRKRKYAKSERVHHFERALDMTPYIQQLENLITMPIKIPSAHVHFPSVPKQKARNFFSTKGIWNDEASYREEVSKLFNTKNVEGDRKQVLSLMLDESDSDSGSEHQPLTLKNLRQMLKIHKKRRALQTKCHEDPLNTQYKYYGSGLFSTLDQFPAHQKEVIDAFTYDFDFEEQQNEEVSVAENDAELQGDADVHFDPEYIELMERAEAIQADLEYEAMMEKKTGEYFDHTGVRELISRGPNVRGESSGAVEAVVEECVMTEEEMETQRLNELYFELYHKQEGPGKETCTPEELKDLYQRIHEAEAIRGDRRGVKRPANSDVEYRMKVQAGSTQEKDELFEIESEVFADIRQAPFGQHGNGDGDAETSLFEQDVNEYFNYGHGEPGSHHDEQIDEAIHAVFEQMTSTEEDGLLVDSLMTEFDELAASHDGQFDFNLDAVAENSADYEQHALESMEPKLHENDGKKLVSPDVFEQYNAEWDIGAKFPETPASGNVETEQHNVGIVDAVMKESELMETTDANVESSQNEVEPMEVSQLHDLDEKVQDEVVQETHESLENSEEPLDLSKKDAQHPETSSLGENHSQIETPPESSDATSHLGIPIEFTPPDSEEYHCAAMDFMESIHGSNSNVVAASEPNETAIEPQQSTPLSTTPVIATETLDDDEIPCIVIDESDSDTDFETFVARNGLEVVEYTGYSPTSSEASNGA